jgi:hypothetical protein
MGAAGLVGAQTGVVRQHNKIKSSHYLGKFAIEKYDCTHWNCRDCGVAKFFHPECKILTCKPDALVKVATYRDKPRGKGLKRIIQTTHISSLKPSQSGLVNQHRCRIKTEKRGHLQIDNKSS